MKILLIDDSRTMRRLQRTVLEHMGVGTIAEACSAEEALEKAATLRPDLILVDAEMPGADGVMFVKHFRDSDRATPIIVVTTDRDRNRAAEALAAGANESIVKPFTPEILRERVDRVLGEHRLTVSTAVADSLFAGQLLAAA